MRVRFFHCLFASCFRAVAACDPPPRKILVVGDSLSAAYGIDKQRGWVALLQQRLQQRQLDYQVVNASISGDTTRGGLSRLPAALERESPAVLVIALGRQRRPARFRPGTDPRQPAQR